MTVEESHGRPRLTRPRLSDVEALPAPEETASERRGSGRDSRGRFMGGNKVAVRSAEKGMIERRERAALTRELEAAVDCSDRTERVQLLQQTLKLYNATRRDLPAESPVVLSSALAFAREHVIAARLFEAANDAGIATKRGLALLDAAQKAEARAERASLHATTLAAKLAASVRGQRVVDAEPWLEEPAEPQAEQLPTTPEATP